MPTGAGVVTTADLDLNEIFYGKVLPIIAAYNEEEVLDLRAMFCEDWDESYRKFPANDRWKFQKLGEGGTPDYKKIIWGKRQMDTTKYGLGLGYTLDWLFSGEATETEILKRNKLAIARDRVLQESVILNVMARSSTDGFFNGSFTSNEKMTTPISYGANSFNATHTHYVGAGSSTLALSYITAAKEHIKQHGYNKNLLGFANADFMKQVEDLAGWAALTSTSFVISNKIVDNIAVEGFKGRLLGIDWKETEMIPDGYFMLVGESATMPEKAVSYIQKAKPAGQGLKLFRGNDPDYPIIESFYIHWLAAQVALRGAGVMYYLASSWTNPTITGNIIE